MTSERHKRAIRMASDTVILLCVADTLLAALTAILKVLL